MNPTVTLKWLKPIPIEELDDNPDFIRAGVYCILRQYKDKMTVFYVGKSDSQSTRKRLKDHANSGKTGNIRGKKYVTIAAVDSTNAKGLDPKKLIDDIESALIYKSQPEINIQKKTDFSFKKAATIKNTGFYPREFGSTIDFVELQEQCKDTAKKPKKKKTSDDSPHSKPKMKVDDKKELDKRTNAPKEQKKKKNNEDDDDFGLSSPFVY